MGEIESQVSSMFRPTESRRKLNLAAGAAALQPASIL